MDGIFFRADLELFEEAVIQRPRIGPAAFAQHRGTVAALMIVADGRAGGLRLRVIQGNEERESLELSWYIQGANAARVRGTQEFSEDMPIYGCVDEPKARLALRYHLAQGHIRITRLRFKQAEQCSLLAQIMKERGMPLRSMASPQERPVTAPGNMHARQGTSSSVTAVGDHAPQQFGALNDAPVLREQRLSQADLISSTEFGRTRLQSAFMPGQYPLSSELSLPRLPPVSRSILPKSTATQRPISSTFSSLALPDLPKPTPVTGRSLIGHHIGLTANPDHNQPQPCRGQQDVIMDDYSLPPSAQYRRDEVDGSQMSNPYPASSQQHVSGSARTSNSQYERERAQDERRDSVLEDDDSDGLRAFARQPEEERRAVLDDYLLKKLDDPNFVKLCEDLETCWRARLYGQK